MPQPGQSWQAAAFEMIITFGLILMILNMANGPKLNGPFVPLAVGAYILAWGTMGGPYESLAGFVCWPVVASRFSSCVLRFFFV